VIALLDYGSGNLRSGNFSSGMKNHEPRKILLAAAFNRQSCREFSHSLAIC
jgi:hypothetical protein